MLKGVVSAAGMTLAFLEAVISALVGWWINQKSQHHEYYKYHAEILFPKIVVIIFELCFSERKVFFKRTLRAKWINAEGEI
jgi:hypothetical protein